jgi:hypothetical protein
MSARKEAGRGIQIGFAMAISQMRAQMRADIAAADVVFAAEIEELRAELAQCRAELARLRALTNTAGIEPSATRH